MSRICPAQDEPPSSHTASCTTVATMGLDGTLFIPAMGHTWASTLAAVRVRILRYVLFTYQVHVVCIDGLVPWSTGRSGMNSSEIRDNQPTTHKELNTCAKKKGGGNIVRTSIGYSTVSRASLTSLCVRVRKCVCLLFVLCRRLVLLFAAVVRVCS